MAEKPAKKAPRKASHKDPNISCDRVWARRVNINDENDNLRATIAAEGSRAWIALLDEEGTERVTIAVEGNNEAVIGINSKKDILVGMRVSADGRRVLQVNDDEGRCVFEAGVGADNAPFIRLAEPDGGRTWELKKPGAG